METAGARRRLAAILSTDAVGYSRRMAEDDVATVETMRSHRETIRGIVREHHGRVVDAVGDNLLAEFSSAVDAVACAIAAQKLLGERNGRLPDERRLPFRIGLHLGDVLVDDGQQIYGDGVNIAARLEGLAEAGGICASGAIVEQVRGKVEAGFADLGEQELKNIPAPVRTWRVHEADEAAETTSLTVPGFGGQPAIAVMPFENRSGDPEQEYLADGIVEDVIARLSAFRSFPVIARSSTFTYKGKKAGARQVSRELGARYVVEGSVRRAGNRLRVAIQLVDGPTGHQMQAERYDRELDDVFELQDEIAETIVGVIEPTVLRAERRRARAKSPASLDAWEALQRGNAHFAESFGRRWKRQEAEQWFRRSTELDPGCAAAWAGLAWTKWTEFHGDLGSDPALLAEGLELAKKSVRLEPEHTAGYVALGHCLASSDPDAALRAFERAVELNPSDARGWFGMSNVLMADRPDEALALVKKSIRLAPGRINFGGPLHGAALCCFVAGHDEEAIRWVRQALGADYGPPALFRLLGAALGHEGQSAEAREAIDEAMRLDPNFTVARLRDRNSPRLAERLLDGWKKAGWSPPE